MEGKVSICSKLSGKFYVSGLIKLVNLKHQNTNTILYTNFNFSVQELTI